MASSHSPPTSKTRKVGPVSTPSDVETVALPEAEVERLTKSIMYISQILSKGKNNIANTIYLRIAVRSTGGFYPFSELYLPFHLLTGQILA